jgi:hypothetical protein
MAVVALGAPTASFFACASRDEGVLPAHVGPPGSDDDDSIIDLEDSGGPPPVDAPGFCGNQIHQAIANAPNLYFVLDASGSMAAPAPGGTRYEVVREAAIELVRSLGPLIKIGAALFPHEATQGSPCHTGDQVFAVQQGDAITGTDGPVTAGFKNATDVAPEGGTPTAATLEELYPILSTLSGKTAVLLLTDGGPNCNPDATCTLDDCLVNIEGQCTPPDVNCCDPNVLPQGQLNCLDRAATLAAIGDLADLGIDVYVIGIAGSEKYETTLSQMAIVGGAATPNAPFYYKVDDLTKLTDVFGEIASVVVSCEFDLLDPPEEPGFTNVYLDFELLPLDPIDGWDWKSEATVELRGEACNRLKNGQVKQVQIVSGCPTETPK